MIASHGYIETQNLSVVAEIICFRAFGQERIPDISTARAPARPDAASRRRCAVDTTNPGARCEERTCMLVTILIVIYRTIP